MIQHLTEPTTNRTVPLLKDGDQYQCPECLKHFITPLPFCWLCGVRFEGEEEKNKPTEAT